MIGIGVVERPHEATSRPSRGPSSAGSRERFYACGVHADIRITLTIDPIAPGRPQHAQAEEPLASQRTAIAVEVTPFDTSHLE